MTRMSGTKRWVRSTAMLMRLDFHFLHIFRFAFSCLSTSFIETQSLSAALSLSLACSILLIVSIFFLFSVYCSSSLLVPLLHSHFVFPDDISATWYPPLLNTLSLLSKLYGCLEIKIFEHFASQLIFFCLNSIKKGSEKIKQNGGRAANGGEINGDLFLIRHLLILREQLIPFNIKLQKKNLNLDFLPSQKALNVFVMNNVRSIVNFNGNRDNNNGNNGTNSNSNNYNNDPSSFSSNIGSSSNSYFYNNSFFQLAREGLPGIVEKEIFIKKDLDLDLKNACQALKDSVLKNIFGCMDSFLAKIGAFAGDFSAPSASTPSPRATLATATLATPSSSTPSSALAQPSLASYATIPANGALPQLSSEVRPLSLPVCVPVCVPV